MIKWIIKTRPIFLSLLCCPWNVFSFLDTNSACWSLEGASWPLLDKWFWYLPTESTHVNQSVFLSIFLNWPHCYWIWGWRTLDLSEQVQGFEKILADWCYPENGPILNAIFSGAGLQGSSENNEFERIHNVNKQMFKQLLNDY